MAVESNPKSEVVQDVYDAVYCYNGFYYKVTESSEIHDRITSDPSFADGWFARMKSCDAIVEDALPLVHEDSNSSNLSNVSYSLHVNDSQGVENEGSNFSNPTESTLEECKDNYFWRRKGVLALIECYREHQEQMNDPKRKKKSVWSYVAERMKEKGESVTGEMCDRKWRNLKKTYLTVKNNKSLSRKDRRTWEYFDFLDEIHGQENQIDPVFTFSTMSPVVEKLPSNSDVIVVETSVEEPSPKKRKLTTSQSDQQADNVSENRLWPSINVLTLIECYKQERNDMLDPRRKKKDVWSSIAEKMKEKGIFVTGDMCDRKWRNLKITYKTVKDNPKRRSWEFFDVLYDIFGDMSSESISSPMLSADTASNNLLPKMTVTATGVAAADDGHSRKRNAVVALQKYLETVNDVRCSELKRLRESIEESNKLNREKNSILKDAQKERNLILKESLREKNDILRELLRLRRDRS